MDGLRLAAPCLELVSAASRLGSTGTAVRGVGWRCCVLALCPGGLADMMGVLSDVAGGAASVMVWIRALLVDHRTQLFPDLLLQPCANRTHVHELHVLLHVVSQGQNLLIDGRHSRPFDTPFDTRVPDTTLWGHLSRVCVV